MHFKIALSKNTFQKADFKIPPSKNTFQNYYHKDTFSASISAIKDKIGINKSLIMHD